MNHVCNLIMKETKELSKNVLHRNKHLLLLLLQMPLLFLNHWVFQHHTYCEAYCWFKFVIIFRCLYQIEQSWLSFNCLWYFFEKLRFFFCESLQVRCELTLRFHEVRREQEIPVIEQSFRIVFKKVLKAEYCIVFDFLVMVTSFSSWFTGRILGIETTIRLTWHVTSVYYHCTSTVSLF